MGAMSFESAGNLLSLATNKYRLTRQANSALICTRVNNFIVQEYTAQASQWHANNFEAGKLSIKVANSAASSELFMRTHEILEALESLDLPHKVKNIHIQKS